MNFLRTFEDHVAGIFGAARAPFSFKKLAKQAAHEMEDQTLVVNGTNTAPALYTILISADDDALMAPFYPELASEVSSLVRGQAEKKRYTFVGEPLVRFMIDPELKPGRFSVFAENVDAPTLARLYEEERAYQRNLSQSYGNSAVARAQEAPMPRQRATVSTPQPHAPKVSVPVPSIGGTAASGLAQDMAAARAGAHAAGVAGAAAIAGAAAASALDSISAGAQPDVVADPFAAPEAPIPVPKTVTREALAGMGGAAATGASLGIGAVPAQSANRAASPAEATAQLVDVVSGDVYEVHGPACVIGRERAVANVALRDPNVSRRHAQLTSTGTDWSIEDLNSTNGTLVNNRRITRCPLRNGDLLTFGLSTFEFRS